jgi:hypothetical protein
MIPQEHIQRTKTNLEWLAEKYPEKFTMYPYENTSSLVVSEFMLNIPNGYRRGLLAFKRDGTLLVFYDPVQQFSNAIGRIFWEAWEEKLIVLKYNADWHYIPDRSSLPRDYPKEYELHTPLQSTEELSAQLEALNLRIEQERGK